MPSGALSNYTCTNYDDIHLLRGRSGHMKEKLWQYLQIPVSSRKLKEYQI